ncbi:MAG: hypothetical protein WBM09_03790 [Gallionella sp.]
MSISSKQKTWILFGILIIIGGAAFVYLDPLELHLLGPEPVPVVVKPAPPHVAAPAPKPAAPKPVAAMPAATTETAKPVATEPAMAPAQAPLLPVKSSQTNRTTSKPAVDKPVRPKNLDLRHCLDLKTDAEIAKCAGE